MWEGFVVESLQRSWEMARRGLDPKMIAKIHDIVERNFSKMFARLDARAKKVKVEEVGFVDQFVEPDTKPTEQLEVFAEGIPNLVDVGVEVGFHDQLVESDMETAEHLVMDDLVDVGGDLNVAKHLVVDDPVAVDGKLCIAEHLIVSNEIASLACIDGDLHVGADVEFVVADVGFVATGVDSLVADVNEVLLMKHYVQFVPGGEHANWIVEILVFDRVIQMWKICMVVFLSLLRWKPLVKMKTLVDFSFHVKVWDTLF